jgi:hypothetical protein
MDRTYAKNLDLVHLKGRMPFAPTHNIDCCTSQQQAWVDAYTAIEAIMLEGAAEN